jgi:hypothetical protein
LVIDFVSLKIGDWHTPTNRSLGEYTSAMNLTFSYAKTTRGIVRMVWSVHIYFTILWPYCFYLVTADLLS